ncbi:MAG: hypothetical protein A3G33_11190 [Omnitrophica bacterium RIFCSPLOWO2_12_FULL_44_17]|uniref:Methyltransferase type 11 domain-containing protein n=1 Tax=Candidatus Danuiimicrobium aquiferis TaxID=1801832 RepID=A0A1G1KRX1_9BACT|nr:MAG: hypothetical protein A3B72_09025 [Omnitrophica bacterium RIFCSPHIGHO2_02_FULL_45_28]OGW95562.1 MAG: hypothetical protein A3G33_11190 [Omnitrophica bacterium RIFCSPLOWO2_12_FULL_44_17]OGX03723.1 MAG: hypothetical protein A3J12_01300 [Omnitrophica bacterium RIFCSPLOWO2_02_FULL_44_11]
MLKKFLEKLFPFLFSSRTYLAYGVEEAPTKYPLDKARYPLMAAFIREEYLKLKRPIKVLDMGCHEGMMLLYTKQNQTDAEFYGMDILEERLNKAMQRGYQSVTRQDIQNFPYPFNNGFFDAVICSHILEHLEYPEKVLQELNRVMKRDGLLIVGVPVGLLPGILWRRYMTPMYNPWKRKKEVLKRFGHIQFFTLPVLKKLLKRYGFVTEEARGDFLIRARKFFLENYKWWYKFNQWYGKIFPGVLGHVTLKARFKPAAH